MTQKSSLVIGGTRNLGPSLVAALLQEGYRVTVFNRGQTAAVLPTAVERVYGDRGNREQFRAALGTREFDLVVDTTLYNRDDARTTVELLRSRAGRYIFLSTGQVYLVRQNVARPFREQDYPGPTIPEPAPEDHFNHGNWSYGIDKRAAEDVLAEAWEHDGFPFISLRLPMVNSERDHFDRIYGYLLRLRDGGPILLPEGSHLPLRHVYGDDVVQAVVRAANPRSAAGRAFNISQEETVSMEDFLQRLSRLAGLPCRVARIPWPLLESAGLVPDSSPFSEPWMSELDNTLSKRELGMQYTALDECLQRLLAHYAGQIRIPEGYRRRDVELKLAENLAKS